MSASPCFAPARQLALPLDEPSGFSPDDFTPGACNAEARVALANPDAWVNHRLVLWGEAGCGKSHLTAIWAQATGAPIIAASTLRTPIHTENQATPLVIEDIDATADPLALLANLNIAHAAPRPVLLTSRTPPARLALDPADLASRLRASLIIEITPADDQLLAMLLDRLIAKRQLRLNEPLRAYLLSHLPRQPGILREAVTRLDRAALARGIAPSRRLAEHILVDLLDSSEPEAKLPPDRAARSPNFHATQPLLAL